MYVFKAGLSFLLILCVVKSEDVDNEPECNDYYKDMNNKPITNVTHYCNNKFCIIKCCGDGEILNHKGICKNASNFKVLSRLINYSNVTLYTWNGSAPKISHKNLTKDFDFIQNNKLASYYCTDEYLFENFYILENGTLRVESYNTWIDKEVLDYCIDYRVYFNKVNNTIKKRLKLIFRETKNTEPDKKSKFVVIAMLTSCIFMLLVLAVYCLLRQLRNIVGMILMGYVWSLFVTFLMRAVLVLSIASLNHNDCKRITPLLYYASLSSFFWLTVMSFDVWWTFRGTRKCRDIHRRGELVKFMWYGLYAWGAPLVLTIPAVIVDNMDLPESTSIIKPPFSSCLADDVSVFYYLQIPIAIICSVNIILFIMTAYNIWMIKNAVHNCQDIRISKKEENRFGIYIKLAVIMGVGWCMEFIPDTPLWMFVIINFYNVFQGVTIFFLFVFKKSIFIMLCKRFGINNKFTRNMASENSRSYNMKSSTFKSRASRSMTQETNF